jgi:hypothetical protein
MAFQLGIGTGSQAGRVVALPLNTPLSIGRTRAMLLFPDDPTMSGLHFELVCDERTVALRNHSQTNGTYVNGSRVEEIVLHPGDVIMAGGTRFILGASGEDSLSPPLQVQHWFFPALPAGWEQLDDQGLRYVRDGSQATTLMITEEAIPAGHTLDQYVDIQLRLIGERLPTAQAVKAPVELTDVDASMGLSIRSGLPDGRVVIQKQIYACVGQGVGILTATILESEPPEVHEAVDKLLMTASFRPSGKGTDSPESAPTQSES